MESGDLLQRFQELVVRDKLWTNWSNMEFYFRLLFREVDFAGKTMLDVGAGTGLGSAFAACAGAHKVVALEPEAAGATSGVRDKFERIVCRLGLDQVSLLAQMFQDFDSGGEQFDVVFLHNSVNHLDENACISLLHDGGAREVYLQLLRKLGALTRSGGKLIIVDCSRYNFFARLKLKNPFAPSIEWHKHQAPGVWSELLEKCGFSSPKIRWTTFNTLRTPGRILLGNKLAAYFLQSHFCLTMDKG